MWKMAKGNNFARFVPIRFKKDCEFVCWEIWKIKATVGMSNAAHFSIIIIPVLWLEYVWPIQVSLNFQTIL